jgi:hypothetical protein
MLQLMLLLEGIITIGTPCGVVIVDASSCAVGSIVVAALLWIL